MYDYTFGTYPDRLNGSARSVAHKLVGNQFPGAEHVQTYVEGCNLDVVKGHVDWGNYSNKNFERLVLKEDGLHRIFDSSPGEPWTYMVNGGDGGLWLPLKMRKGDRHLFRCMINWRLKANGYPVNSDPSHPPKVPFDHYVVLEDVYDSWQSPSGAWLPDVIKLHQQFPTEDTPFEYFWYAKGKGLVGYQNVYTGFKSWYDGDAPGITLTREDIPWFEHRLDEVCAFPYVGQGDPIEPPKVEDPEPTPSDDLEQLLEHLQRAERQIKRAIRIANDNIESPG